MMMIEMPFVIRKLFFKYIDFTRDKYIAAIDWYLKAGGSWAKECVLDIVT